MEQIKTKRTSSHSADVVEPFILEEKQNTRRVFFAVINDSKKSTGETVSGVIVHQRKSKKQEWEDIPTFSLAKIKAGEEVKLTLHSHEVKNLYESLTKLYSVSSDGINPGITEFTAAKSSEILKVPSNRKTFIQKLLDQDFEKEVWEELVKSNPDLATRLSIARIQQDRIIALQEFEESLTKELGEDYWQNFFSNNDWIFGYGLNYQFLNKITDQPKYGGENVEGKGNQKGDFLMNTIAHAKFTVLVEIKKPESNLISRKASGEARKYRNGAMLLSAELVGGTSQIQVNADKWAFSSQLPDKKLEDVETIRPKGILIIGHTKELENDDQIRTFENYRQSLTHPKILTFDELFERAKYIVDKNQINEVNEEEKPNDDDYDLPF